MDIVQECIQHTTIAQSAASHLHHTVNMLIKSIKQINTQLQELVKRDAEVQIGFRNGTQLLQQLIIATTIMRDLTQVLQTQITRFEEMKDMVNQVIGYIHAYENSPPPSDDEVEAIEIEV
ncbi:uncharacterized protein LOC109859779 [Pseudomyrmex gracilis]|uniref:uncharacterized protein LOC109859779 n=1 Tax=Pseudomyrmex gracilis TaxID=219809 RepID=UPI0009951F02|nr:uncharacterized protein LOC109859779 [Pseudomyrmex gracilis]